MKWLCDTNIISEPMKKKPSQKVLHWLEELELCSLSVITLEEIYCGLSYKEAAKQRAWFEKFLQHRCEVLPVSSAIAMQCGILRGRFLQEGITRTQADLLIAATALDHKIPLATKNVKDFKGCGIILVNPFVWESNRVTY